MRVKSLILFISLCFLLASATVGAANYKNWMPFLPQSIDGMSKSAEPRGINMQSSDQSWSMLNQKYTGEDQDRVTLTIVKGSVSPHMREFQSMEKFNMESGKEMVRSLEVSGYKAIVRLDKKNQNGILGIMVNQNSLVVIKADPAASEDRMVSLAKELPLEKIGEALR